MEAQTEDAVEELLLAEAALAEAKSSAPQRRGRVRVRASRASPALREDPAEPELAEALVEAEAELPEELPEERGAPSRAERSGAERSHT